MSNQSIIRLQAFARGGNAAIFSGALLAGLLLGQQAPDHAGGGAVPGSPSPSVVARGASNTVVRLDDFRGSRRVLLVFAPPAEFAALRAAAPDLAKLRAELLLVDLPPADEKMRAAARAFSVRGPTIVLIDEGGIIRRIERAAASAQDLERVVRRWEDGRALYNSNCARCHGEDGNATGYPGIKKLGGIGNRMSEEEILEATAATGVVDLSSFRKEQLKSLAIYVAGL